MKFESFFLRNGIIDVLISVFCDRLKSITLCDTVAEFFIKLPMVVKTKNIAVTFLTNSIKNIFEEATPIFLLWRKGLLGDVYE